MLLHVRSASCAHSEMSHKARVYSGRFMRITHRRLYSGNETLIIIVIDLSSRGHSLLPPFTLTHEVQKPGFTSLWSVTTAIFTLSVGAIEHSSTSTLAVVPRSCYIFLAESDTYLYALRDGQNKSIHISTINLPVLEIGKLHHFQLVGRKAWLLATGEGNGYRG